MKVHLKALGYGSHRVAPANYTIPAYTLRTFARWRHLNDERLSWPSWLTYSGRCTHISCHTSATDRAEVRESSPVRDRRSNHWATQPILTQWSAGNTSVTGLCEIHDQIQLWTVVCLTQKITAIYTLAAVSRSTQPLIPSVVQDTVKHLIFTNQVKSRN